MFKPTHGYRTVRDYHAAYTTRQTTPTAVLERLLRFVDATNATLRCIQQVDVTGARAAAAASTQRYTGGGGVLPRSLWDGVPVMIKSEIKVAGLITTNGQPWHAVTATDDDDTVQEEEEDVIVQRLRAAGAVIVAS